MMKSFKYLLPLSNEIPSLWNSFSFGKEDLLIELRAPLFALSDHFHELWSSFRQYDFYSEGHFKRMM